MNVDTVRIVNVRLVQSEQNMSVCVREICLSVCFCADSSCCCHENRRVRKSATTFSLIERG